MSLQQLHQEQISQRKKNPTSLKQGFKHETIKLQWVKPQSKKIGK